MLLIKNRKLLKKSEKLFRQNMLQNKRGQIFPLWASIYFETLGTWFILVSKLHNSDHITTLENPKTHPSLLLCQIKKLSQKAAAKAGKKLSRRGWKCVAYIGCSQLWQYGLWSFQARDTKLERFLPKNQHSKITLMNFENWCK